MNTIYRQLIVDLLAYLRQIGIHGESQNEPLSSSITAEVVPLQPLKRERAAPPDKEEREAPPKSMATPPAQPKASSPSVDFSELFSIVKKTAPNLPLHKTPLDDSEAQEIANRWKVDSTIPDIVLIHWGEQGATLQMLQNLSQAIDRKLRPAKLIDGGRFESEKKWDLFLAAPRLKRLLISRETLEKTPHLLTTYRELPATNESFLGTVPVTLLAPYASYVHNPELKKELWRHLLDQLKS